MNLRDNSLGENYVLFRNWAILTIFGLNFLQKTANRDFVKILRFAVSVFLNFYCGSVLVRFGLDTLVIINSTWLTEKYFWLYCLFTTLYSELQSTLWSDVPLCEVYISHIASVQLSAAWLSWNFGFVMVCVCPKKIQ